jgi:hypothetical protein
MLRYEALLEEEKAKNIAVSARITELEEQLAIVTSGNQQREQQLTEEIAEHEICKEQLTAARDANGHFTEELQQIREEQRVTRRQLVNTEANLSLVTQTNKNLEDQMTRLVGDLALYRGDLTLVETLSLSKLDDLAAGLAHSSKVVAKRKVRSSLFVVL